MRYWISLASMAMAACLLLGNALAAPFTAQSGPNNCRERMKPPVPKSLQEMVGMSAYIGLYQLVAVEKANTYLNMANGHVVANRRERAYTYQLLLVEVVGGHPPGDLELTGVEPITVLPSYYLALFQVHEWLANNGPTYGGFGSALVNFGGEGCEYVPKLMPGFNFLIFGGINSQARFEPIFFSQADKFYQEVKEQVRIQRAK